MTAAAAPIERLQPGEPGAQPLEHGAAVGCAGSRLTWRGFGDTVGHHVFTF